MVGHLEQLAGYVIQSPEMIQRGRARKVRIIILIVSGLGRELTYCSHLISYDRTVPPPAQQLPNAKSRHVQDQYERRVHDWV